MRVAFYAPMKPPDHPVPSGDRRMARSLIQALERSGHTVEVVCRFRSYDRDGDENRQRRLRTLGARLANRLIRRLKRRPAGARPEALLSYHVYHKSPDHLGPPVARAFAIPYLIVEASVARRRAAGPYAPGFADSARAIEAADVILAMTRIDEGGLGGLVRPPARLLRLAPFTDPAPFQAASRRRNLYRQALAVRHGLEPSRPWLLAVGMMRADAKLESYRRLAQALIRVERPCRLIVVGDGPARGAVEAAFAGLEPPAVFTGELAPDEVARALAAADLFVWPAVREAYGLALLEAAAAGLPVVAGLEGGVEEVVRAGETGLLVEADDPDAFARAVGDLLDEPERRRRMAEAAAHFVMTERSLDGAARTLDQALRTAVAICDRRRTAMCRSTG